MSDAWIVDAVRTPIGRHGGALSAVRPDDLAARTIAALVERTGTPPEAIDDVHFGCTNGVGEDSRNVARMASLLAGLPHSVPGATVNRLCASGLEAVVAAGRSVRAGEGDLFVAGGVESMTRAPWALAKSGRAWATGAPELADTALGWRFVNPRMAAFASTESMGETAENVAERKRVTRAEQDEFALRSHRLACAAADDGRFDAELLRVEAPGRGGRTLVERDEGPRADTTLERLGALRPAFRGGGSVTAGNSSSLNDGAAALLVASCRGVERLGAVPLARIVAAGFAGVDPALMGMGPVPATAIALRRAGLELDQIDLVELNEAFASQALACIRELGLDPERVNPNGGAIALGHPLGCTGARIVGALARELSRRGGRYGLATMCVGVGQGAAIVLENAASGSWAPDLR